MLEELGACTTSLRQIAKKADEALKSVVKCDDCGGAGGLWDARCTTCNGAGYFRK
jgi:DnaJ-class molecular chaperone